MARIHWNRRASLVAVLMAGCLIVSPFAFTGAQESKAPAAAKSQDQAMADLMKLAQPGPGHAFLKSLAGSWKAVSKTWTGGPNDPVVGEGSTETSMILGGRFLKEEFKGINMGQPYEGMGLTGYDNGKKEFVSMWVDTLATGIMMQKGSLDAAGKVLTMNGTYEDPLSGQSTAYRMVTRVVDKNTHIFEMYSKRDGKEIKEMEITYTRK